MSSLPEITAASDLPPDPGEARVRAFRAIYRQEFSFVWATARRLGVPPASVEDAVQDVFLTAYRRMDQIHFEVSARAWLHGVTRRIASRYRRTAARLHRRIAAAAALPPPPCDPPQDRLAAVQHLERLLGRLGGRTRAAFEMAEILGMSGPEIAGELGISVSTVYSRVRLAREQLARELGGDGLARALGEVREGEAPPAAAQQRTWAILVPGLASTGTSTGVGVGAWMSVRGVVIASLLLSAGLGALAWPRIRGEGAPVAAERASRTSPGRSAAARAGVEAAESAETIAPEVPPPVVETAPLQAPGHRRDHAPALPQDPRRRAAAGEGAGSGDRPLSEADRLAAEVALLDRARAALAGGDIDAAAVALDEHARRFRGGALADLRGATEVELLCRRGQAREAEARAAALADAHPGSAVAERFAGFACP